MDRKLSLTTAIAYADVDREERLRLSSLLKLLQEAAIRHANQFDTGTEAMVTRGESWVLNRMAVEVARYPKFEEELRIETWSSGIAGFRGYREFRGYVGTETVLSASSLWIYIHLATKQLVRVPADVAETFPTVPGEVHLPQLDRLTPPAVSNPVHTQPITLRYSDVDGNGHVNNTAYLEYLQTALARAGQDPQVRVVQLKFAREIPPETHAVEVALEPRDGAMLFCIRQGDVLFAHGLVR